MHFTQQSRMPCFFYVTNSVYMEQKPETGKSTDKTKNACYTSTIKANEKEIREETIMVIRLFCAAGMSTSLLVKKMEEAASSIRSGMWCNILHQCDDRSYRYQL